MDGNGYFWMTLHHHELSKMDSYILNAFILWLDHYETKMNILHPRRDYSLGLCLGTYNGIVRKYPEQSRLALLQCLTLVVRPH
jgi:hypothetical protein